MNRSPTISAIKPHDEQTSWCADVHAIESPAATRNLVGNFYQEAVRILTGAQEHQIDSRVDICPDLSTAPRHFLEVKSVGRGRQALIYQKRLDNDRRLVRSGARLTYVFVIHNVEATSFVQREQLYAALGTGIECILVIPFERIRRACAKLTPRVMNYRAARSGSHLGAEEMPGYRLSWSSLQAMAHGRCTIERRIGLVHGVEIPSVPLQGALEHAWPALSQGQRDMAGRLLGELSLSPLRITTAPAPRPTHAGHKVRVVESRNPTWYSRLCASVPNTRKVTRRRGQDTGIKRDRVERSLARLMDGRCVTSIDWMLRPLVVRYAAATART